MAKIPRGLSGREVVSALEKAGFRFSRQKGSHILLFRADPKARVTVPDHREVRVGTLQQILSDAGMTVAEFLALLS
ncbi:MAG: type II toxin-antitoxin system HicA family toxin [Armatimonadetes bacterium]|nr:type II toxin-antitoxin system HicA family toxin [Armatimonadota bacterium]